MQRVHEFLKRPHLYVVIVMIGISLKFFQLDYKLFWFDEVCTIQHTAGISDKDYPCLVPYDSIKSIGFYTDLYRLNTMPNSLGSELKGLVTSTQLNPMYYPFLMVWYRNAGDTPVDFRLFSVFLFIVSLPFLFLLSKKLFKSTLAGWITVSLYSISPFIHVFAQEARYYIFWTLIVILMHYLFLQAMHHNKNKWWFAYSVIGAVSLYASPLSIVLLFGHGAFILCTQKTVLKAYCLSVFTSCLAYLPWALSLYFKLHLITTALSWHSKNQDDFNALSPLFGQFLYILSMFSYKLDYLSVLKQSSFPMTPEHMVAILFNVAVLAMICFSIFFLIKNTGKEIFYFLVLIIAPGLVFFYVHDIIRTSIASWWWRYLIFISPGIFLLITNVLYKKIEKGHVASFICFLGLVFIGISSIFTISKAKYWHIGGSGMNMYVEVAHLISKSEHPLIITDFLNDNNMVNLMVVLEECTSDNIDILKASPTQNLTDLIGENTYSDIYVLYASNKLTDHLKRQFGNSMEPMDMESVHKMWTLKTTPLLK